jgi:hypothetical protein
MKLNPECIRDILLDIEDFTNLNKPFVYQVPYKEETRLSTYDKETALYHIKQCELSHFFTGVNWFMDGGCMIRYLSPSGHQFIADIREDNNWNKTKEVAKSVGSNSLDALKQIAASIISSLIQSQLGG